MHMRQRQKYTLAVYNPRVVPRFIYVAARRACVDGGARERLFRGFLRRAVSINLCCLFHARPVLGNRPASGRLACVCKVSDHD